MKQRYEYKVMNCGRYAHVEEILNEHAVKGWRLVSIEWSDKACDATRFVFEREVAK